MKVTNLSLLIPERFKQFDVIYFESLFINIDINVFLFIIRLFTLRSGCGRVVYAAGRKAKRMVLQCINSVGSNPVEGRTTI